MLTPSRPRQHLSPTPLPSPPQPAAASPGYSLQYAHQVQVYPPYALTTVAHAERPPADHDVFVHLLGNSWGRFLRTVHNREVYAEGVTERDVPLPDLAGEWGGDKTLNEALYLDQSFLDEPRRHWWSRKPAEDDDSETTKTKRLNRLVPQYRRQQWGPFYRRVLLSDHYLPLVLRLVIIILCVVSLSLAANIYVRTKGKSGSSDPSTVMALCVQLCALVYLVYVAYDEFSAQPIGLRDPRAKMRLLMLDLFFIICSSANFALAASNLTDDRWVCRDRTVGVVNSGACDRQSGLVAVLFVVLAMWVLTYAVSVTRVVERVGGDKRN